MFRGLTLAIVAVLFACPDVPQEYHLRPQLAELPSVSFDDALQVFPNLFLSVDQDQKSAAKSTTLQPQSELAIIRYVHGEFAKVVRPMPAAKKGFHLQAGQPLDEKALHQALVQYGPAVNAGDTVQITRIQFLEKQIVVDVNGGGRKRRPFRQRVHIEIGGPYPTTTMSQTPRGATSQVPGATLVLDYGRAVPDMSPDDLKRDLSGFLDFSKERSAAVQWVETLPPQFKEAIKERKALVGMDRDMVLAALGRPEHKVREKAENGDETEDWIYGDPPAKTIFVTFLGDKVVRVEEFP